MGQEPQRWAQAALTEIAYVESAAFKPDNCFSTRSRSFRNCFAIEDKLPFVSPAGTGL